MTSLRGNAGGQARSGKEMAGIADFFLIFFREIQYNTAISKDRNKNNIIVQNDFCSALSRAYFRSAS
jgi:hypothetical protein